MAWGAAVAKELSPVEASEAVVLDGEEEGEILDEDAF
jgi:hypothetical protein